MLLCFQFPWVQKPRSASWDGALLLKDTTRLHAIGIEEHDLEPMSILDALLWTAERRSLPACSPG
jgi:hypothetical protein